MNQIYSSRIDSELDPVFLGSMITSEQPKKILVSNLKKLFLAGIDLDLDLAFWTGNYGSGAINPHMLYVTSKMECRNLEIGSISCRIPVCK